jgi:hypothetical protein
MSAKFNLSEEDNDYVCDLPRHLVDIGTMPDEAYRILTDIDFLEHRIERTSVEKLIEDYQLVEGSTLPFTERQKRNLTLVKDAILESKGALKSDPSQLSKILLECLSASDDPDIQGMVEFIKNRRGAF